MPTINIKDSPAFKTVRLIDLTEDSINHIAEVVVSKLNKSVRHGRWLWLDGVRCSICNHKLQTTGLTSYCPNCGAKMDEVEDV